MRAVSILLGALLPASLAFAAPAKPKAADKKPSAAAPADPSMKMEEDPSMMMGAKTADVTPEQAAFFESKIAPILSEACYKCHSLEKGKSKGGLTMDTKEGLAKGGETGPLFKGSDPSKSLLITAVSYQDEDLQMPPKGEKLSKQQIADLVAWAKMGAPDPRAAASAAVVSKLSGLTDKARSHWAFQPIEKPAIPNIQNRAWCKTPVDAFIMAKLEEKKMLPQPGLLDRAEFGEKETLLRRATYDLLGIPPTPKEIDAFVRDTSPQAFALVVERLLASPRYGERWGRFWLDSARYADTVGGNRDRDKDYRYPYAWTYRDWVINAFNSDMPYDQFVIQQLAADLLPNNPKKNLAALGFITVGERFGNNNDDINDRIDTVSKGFLGLTVACARCHDHMFDPIPTEDYYALHGVFASIREPEEKPLLNDTDPKLLEDFQQKVAKYEEMDRKTYYDILQDAAHGFRQKAVPYMMAGWLSGRKNNEKALKEREALIKEHNLDEQFARFVEGQMRGNGSIFGPLQSFLDMPDGDISDFPGVNKAKAIADDKRYNARVRAAFRGLKPRGIEDVIQVYEKVFSGLSDDDAKGAITAAREATGKGSFKVDKDVLEIAAAPLAIAPAYEMSSDRIRSAIDRWPQRLENKGEYHFAAINELKLTHDGSPVKAMVVEDRDNPSNSPVFIRGQAGVRGDMVPRSFLEVLTPGGKRKPFTKGSGRLELAQDIASKTNPLTARVIVNRVWMHHFGEGFVRTPDDLGTQSEPPSHPELIDYLASYLMERNWSLKDLHRLIMRSKVYQLSSRNVKEFAEIDPANRLLWRANVRRLDFEAMRDSMLAMANKLDNTLGGQPVNLTDEPYSYRRSVYGYIDRGNLPELMMNFDFGDPHMTNSKRSTTIVPQQALFLMNSPFAVDVARSVIARSEVRNAPDNLRRVDAVFKIILQRTPFKDERAMALQFLHAETDAAPEMQAEVKELTEKSAKKVAEMEKREDSYDGMDGLRAIRNEGKWIERKPLTEWETFAQALLFSNEAAYVN